MIGADAGHDVSVADPPEDSKEDDYERDGASKPEWDDETLFDGIIQWRNPFCGNGIKVRDAEEKGGGEGEIAWDVETAIHDVFLPVLHWTEEALFDEAEGEEGPEDGVDGV